MKILNPKHWEEKLLIFISLIHKIRDLVIETFVGTNFCALDKTKWVYTFEKYILLSYQKIDHYFARLFRVNDCYLIQIRKFVMIII